MKDAGKRVPGEIALTWTLGILSAFGPVSTDTSLPTLPTLARELAAPAGVVQLTLSAFFIGFGIGQVLYGPFSDRFGRRPLLILGILVYVVTSVLGARSESIETLITLRFFQALGGGAGTVIARAVVRDWFDPLRGARVMSYMMLITGMAPLIGPTVGAYLLQWFSWRAVYWNMAAFGGCCLVLVLLGLPESNPPERRTRGNPLAVFKDYAQVLANRPAVFALLASSVSFGGLFAFLSGGPFVFIEFFGVSPKGFGGLFAINVVGMMTGSFLNGRLVTTLGVRPLLIAATSLAAVSGLSLLATAATGFGGLFGIAVPFVFYWLILSPTFVNAIALASMKFPTKAGTVAALFGAFQFGVGSFAGFAVSHWHDGTPLPLAIIVATCGVGSFCLVWFTRPRET